MQKRLAELGTGTPTPLPNTGHVAGFVFDDLNGNSLRDNGEPGLAAAQVALLLPDNTLVSSMTTINLFFTDSLSNETMDTLSRPTPRWWPA